MTLLLGCVYIWQSLADVCNQLVVLYPLFSPFPCTSCDDFAELVLSSEIQCIRVLRSSLQTPERCIRNPWIHSVLALLPARFTYLAYGPQIILRTWTFRIYHPLAYLGMDKQSSAKTWFRTVSAQPRGPAAKPHLQWPLGLDVIGYAFLISQGISSQHINQEVIFVVSTLLSISSSNHHVILQGSIRRGRFPGRLLPTSKPPHFHLPSTTTTNIAPPSRKAP